MMLNRRAAPFHYFSPPPPCVPPPPPLQFSYSCRHPSSPPPPPFPYISSSAPLLCAPRFPFLSTYVAHCTAPSPLPPPSFKYLPVADSSASAGQQKTAASSHLQERTGPSTKAEKLPSLSINPSASPTINTLSSEITATSRHRPRPWQRRGARTRFVWVPRSNNEAIASLDTGEHISSSRTSELQLSSSRSADQRTSVMIKNIPNKLSRDMLIDLLDEHCATKNQKTPPDGSPASEYDFIYLPVDFKTRCNLGYAFVNFTTAAAAKKLHDSLHGRKWTIFGSLKVSHVCYARLQGREAFTNHFEHSCFRCDADEFLPAIFDPPRNGSTFCPTPTTIGRRVDPNLFW